MEILDNGGVYRKAETSLLAYFAQKVGYCPVINTKEKGYEKRKDVLANVLVLFYKYKLCTYSLL
jgi:hypothetical protein